MLKTLNNAVISNLKPIFIDFSNGHFSKIKAKM